MLHAVATVGPQLLLTLSMHQRIALTRVSRNMRAAGYRDEEITLVLGGMLRVEHEGGSIDVHAGQAVVTAPGEWVRYSTPGADGAEYVAVCLPAFSPDTVHRDEE